MMVIILMTLLRMMMCNSSGDGDGIGDCFDDGDNVGGDADREIVLVIHLFSLKISQEPPIASQELPSLPRVCL